MLIYAKAQCLPLKHDFSSFIYKDKLQLGNFVLPIFMIIGKETKDSFDTFAKVFEFFIAFEFDAIGINVHVKPFDTHVSWDMSAEWKTTGLGGRA
jgi:hypothetical protein